MESLNIAIIGAGVSGLSSAYELARRAIDHQQKIDITIYEKDKLPGGNAQTVVFSLGYQKNMPSDSNALEFIRWADLGVNDINLSAYTTVTDIMKKIGYLDDNDKKMLPLENTECYFTLDGQIALTDDADMIQGVIDPSHSLQYIENGNLKVFMDLLFDAAIKTVYPNGKDQEENIDITCSEFFDACVAHPKEKLEEFAKTDKYKHWYQPDNWVDRDWLKQASRWVAQLRDHVFYPRISAMYFANEQGPENMLLAAPFHYYSIQESAGGKPDRRYFVGGAQKWLEYLANHVQTEMDPNKDWVNINFVYSAATVAVDGDTVSVSTEQQAAKIYDDIIVTTHANDALRLLTFSEKQNQQTEWISEILGKISYTTSIAVCHTWAGVLPPNRNLWRAYNVIIREGAALKPYSMTYVCNRHQNDADNPNYNVFGSPHFFVTLNPQKPIPDNAILRKLPKALIPQSLHSQLPQETLKQAERLSSHDDNRAITYFQHNLINRDCFIAQKELKHYHDEKPNLYFGGAWTNGSGLHEECWLQSRDIAQRIFEKRYCG